MTITEIPFLSEHRVDKIKKELGAPGLLNAQFMRHTHIYIYSHTHELGAPGSLNNLFLRACFALAII